MGTKEFISAHGCSLATFARAMSVTPQTVVNWYARGIPADRLFDAADVLGVTPDAMRPFVSKGRHSAAKDTGANIKLIKTLFNRLERSAQQSLISELMRASQ